MGGMEGSSDLHGTDDGETAHPLGRAPASYPGELVEEPCGRTDKVWSVTVETAMRELFEVADEDGSGTLDREEIREFVRLVRPSKEMSSAEIEMAMGSMDPEGVGTVTFKDFTRWWMGGGARTAEERREFAQVTTLSHPRESVRAIFNMIDLDGGGSLDREEIRKAGTVLGKVFTAQALDEAMKDMDQEGTGEIDFTSFYAWYTSHRSGMMNDRSNANRLGLTAKLEAEKIARRAEHAAREELMEAHARVVGKSKMRKIFEEIDVDGSGVLDEHEVATFVRKLKPTKFMGSKQRKEAMAAMDVDGSGEVTFDEFCAWWSAGGCVTRGEKLEAKMESTSNELEQVLADLQKCREARASFEDATEEVSAKGSLVVPSLAV